MSLQIHCWIIEFIGSFMLIFVALTQNPVTIGPLGSLFCLSFLTWAGKEISGAHFNPIITLVLLIAKKIDVINGVFYWAA